MAAGDFYIRRNNASAQNIADEPATQNADWDTLVYDEGSIVAYSNPNFQLDIGIYLIMYSEHFISDETTNNERIEIQGEIHVSGTGAVGGYGQDYIRKSSGVGQDCTVSGQMILDVTGDNTDVFIQFRRTDASPDIAVHRVGGHGGVTILELSSSDNFGFYTNTSAQTLSGSTEVDVVLNSNVQQDTGFSRTANAVTISNAGRYLAMYSCQVNQTGTSREDCYAHLEIGTTKIAGTSSYAYLRGDNNEFCDDGALTWIGIIDVSASDVITMRYGSFTSLPGSIIANSLLLQFWQIPSGGDEAVIEATTGDFNTSGLFSWDTQPHLDTASFTYSNGNSNVDIDQDDHVLVFATVSNDTADTPQRAIPRLTLLNDGREVTHASASVYQRNSSSDGVSVTIATIVHLVELGTSIEMRTDPLETTGSLTNDSGQFSMLSLEALYGGYAYVFQPVVSDVDTDEVITNTQTDVVITGKHFEAVKGTGLVELVENSDYTGTKVTQSTDSWADTSIQFDVTAGGLADSHCFLFVTNDTGDKAYLAVQVGLPPETYQEAIESLSPNFYWTFQNTYIDEIASNNANNSSGGTPSFSTGVKIAKGDTHSLQIDGTDYTSPPDITGMNLGTQTRRYFGGWIQVNSVSQILAVLYEEGAQINNIAYLLGFGNNLVIQVADTGDDYVQAYGDVSLTPDRPYHVFFKFHASGFDAEVRLFLDGVLQSRTNGNPWTASDLDAHSGNITWGHEGTEVLQVGDSVGADNVDIAFASPDSCYYAHWPSWHGSTVDPDDIREILFEKGAPAEETIDGDTEANMQTDMDALADTLFTDWPCSIEVETCDDGDFELVLDNITFEDRVSMQIRYLAADTLTLVKENGTVLDTDKLGAPYGGTITVINAPTVAITCKRADTGVVIESALVLILADTGGDLPFEDSVTIARVTTTATVTHTGHGLRTGQQVRIAGAVQGEYNGVKTITVTTVNAYTYTVSGSPTTPATGTIEATSVIVNGTSDVGGLVSASHRYTASQPITGYARKASGSPYYKTGNISGTILNADFNGTIFMIEE